ncbi:diguanylate cyclase domain-containing protein [Kibdelosporangium phytohabitans]|uniref:Diguanylate phosphodiesterase n=1 Tax=Kibdelosporangium phytohabitans TaxID=860235 RepID=A0A0N9I914_9PSEU|nr:diguanylate cyclase [Kibdelosporangium phytohabitans]ALG12883.1 hypothetical protein AOZ06_43910 [Kibdelosporangium phytohabitans]MBE1464587.1 diguanylate cyclase (GGDEF)-like protein/PAS domain S-box-containing protein [Kibdelosporangium phytohabitans]
MTAPQSHRGPARTEIVRSWADAVTARTHVPLGAGELQERLAGLLDDLIAALTSDPFTPERAYDVGTRLADVRSGGTEAMSSTMDLIGAWLGAVPELAGLPHHTERIFSAAGALAAGYCEAAQQAVSAQQEELHQASLGDTRRKLNEVSAELDHVLDGCTTAIALTDPDGRFLRVNHALCVLLGYEEKELDRHDLFDVVPRKDAALFRSLLGRDTRNFQRLQQLVGKDGELAWTRLTLTQPQPAAFVLVFEDYSELQLLRKRMTHTALHDMLTGLPNRQLFASTLETVLRRGVTVCHLDLDGFATLSHGLGRQVGDTVLMHVAHRLRAAVAAENTLVARFGADEFAVLMPLTQPEMIVRHLRNALRPPIEVAGHHIVLTAAIGVVNATNADSADVLAAAELALTRARGLGIGQWSLHAPADRERATSIAVLPTALRTGQVEVTYRPLHRLPGRQPVGADAVLTLAGLSHWDCVVRAENWLLRKVCSADLGLPVHVGLVTADPGEVERITALTGTPPDRLCVSVPAGDRLLPLADTGVGIEIRDFGLADIAFLEALPIKAVRLDRRLRHPGALTSKALRHVLGLVRAAGTSVIVDGLPTWQDAERWQELGADIVAVEQSDPVSS